MHRWSIAALLVTVVVALSSPAGSANPRSASPRSPHPHPVTLGGTFMIGDSTTYRVARELREAEPDWYLDYHWGRSIAALPAHIRSYLRKDPDPSNFVMALGTNQTHHPEWSERRLRRAIGQLPRSTNVFLVMVVRAGRFQASKDRLLRRYNGYSRDLARSRPHTYVINWRKRVLADPTLDPVTGISSLLEDGTHQTGGPHGIRPGPGVRTYVDLVVSKWESVNLRGNE
jgi:hypothetical protein